MIQVSKERLLEFCREHKQEFEQSYGVKSIGVFGSIVRDELQENSDIDIAIEMDSGKKTCATLWRSNSGLSKSLAGELTWVSSNR